MIERHPSYDVYTGRVGILTTTYIIKLYVEKKNLYKKKTLHLLPLKILIFQYSFMKCTSADAILIRRIGRLAPLHRCLEKILLPYSVHRLNSARSLKVGTDLVTSTASCTKLVCDVLVSRLELPAIFSFSV